MNTLFKIKKFFLIFTIFSILLNLNTSYNVSFAEKKLYDENKLDFKNMSNELSTEKKINNLINTYGVSSVQYAVIDNGIIRSSGTYEKKSDSNLSPETMYGIGSLSKMFTAAAVMKLVEEGKISLDDQVFKYIPEFSMKDSRYKEITIRMLLNHSSGLMGSSFSNAFLYDDNDTFSHDKLLNSLKNQRLKANPGLYSVYCNDGFTLAEILVEKVSKKSFTMFIHENFTNKLNMNSTKTPLDTFNRSNLAPTYFENQINPTPIDTVNVIGTGGIYSTAEDMCKFAEIFMENTKNPIILSKKAINQMSHPEYLRGVWFGDTEGFEFGLGWDDINTYPYNLNNIKAFSKGGDTMLYHSFMIVLPEHNIAAVVLSSGGTSLYNKIIADSLISDVLKKNNSNLSYNTSKLSVKTDINSTPVDWDNCNGYYAIMNQLMKISISKDGELLIESSINPNQSEKYVYSHNNSFINQNGISSLTFYSESPDSIYVISDNNLIFPGLGENKISYVSGQKLNISNSSYFLDSTWMNRNQKKYFIINEKYSSQIYSKELPAITISLNDNLPGYENTREIIDEFNSKSNILIPGVAGRDQTDISFKSFNDVEYLYSGSSIAISEDNISNLPNKASFNIQIPDNGNALWMKINSKKTIDFIVNNPKNSSFSIYDESGKFIYSSLTSEKDIVTTPKIGYIVFAGNPKSIFSFEKKGME